MKNNKEIIYEILRDNDKAHKSIMDAFYGHLDTFSPFLQFVKETIKARGGVEVLAKKIGCTTDDIKSCFRCTRNLQNDTLNEIFNAYDLKLRIVATNPRRPFKLLTTVEIDPDELDGLLLRGAGICCDF